MVGAVPKFGLEVDSGVAVGRSYCLEHGVDQGEVIASVSAGWIHR